MGATKGRATASTSKNNNEIKKRKRTVRVSKMRPMKLPAGQKTIKFHGLKPMTIKIKSSSNNEANEAFMKRVLPSKDDYNQKVMSSGSVTSSMDSDTTFLRGSTLKFANYVGMLRAIIKRLTEESGMKMMITKKALMLCRRISELEIMEDITDADRIVHATGKSTMKASHLGLAVIGAERRNWFRKFCVPAMKNMHYPHIKSTKKVDGRHRREKETDKQSNE